jgi:hypothetical protein
MEYTVQEHNATTGEVIVRPITTEELEVLNADNIQAEKNRADALQTKADKAALLARLGMTADEAKLLLS